MAEPAVAGDYIRQPGDSFADAPAQRAEHLWRLFDAAHAGTEACIVDCAERAQAKGAVVRGLRITVLSLLVLAASASVLAGPLGDLQDGAAIGGVLLAFAGGLALFDRVFGVSRSAVRDRHAQARLEALAVSLRYAWVARLAKSGDAISDAAAARDLADLILTHVAAIEGLTEAETGAWIEPVRIQLRPFQQTPPSTEAAP